jgi:cytochrome bd-type quinol oxidase subunit 1
VVVIVYLFLDVSVFASLSCAQGHTTYGHLSGVFTILFSVLGVVFFISGTVMAINLKKYYPDFYKEYGKLIWLATFCLALPLFLRAIHSRLYHKG